MTATDDRVSRRSGAVLLATVALLGVIAAAPAARAEVSATAGMAVFTLPPLPGIIYDGITDWHLPALPIHPAAFGLVPVYGGVVDIPVGGRFGIYGGGFYVAAASGFTAESYLADGGNFALLSLYPGLAQAVSWASYPYGASAYAYASGGLDLNAYTFTLAMGDGDIQWRTCHDTVDGCEGETQTGLGDPGPAFAYATSISNAGILIAVAGIAPEDALAVTQTAGFRYFGGQFGLSADLDLFAPGTGTATAFAGAIVRSLGQSQSTTVNFDFTTPVDGGTLAIAHHTTTTETLDSRYYGAVFGLSLDKDVGRILTAGLDLGIAPLLMRTQYTGIQVSSLDVTGPDTDVHVVTDLDPVTETFIRGAALVSLGGNVGFRLGSAAQLTFGGFLEFLSATPRIQRYVVPGVTYTEGQGDGQYIPGMGGNINIYTANPNNLGMVPLVIGFQPMMSYGASVSLSIGIGGR